MKRFSFTFLVLLALLSWSSQSKAQQCLLNCIDLVNISLDSACTRNIVPGDVLTDTTNCSAVTRVFIDYPYPEYTALLGPNGVDKRLVGYKLVYRVVDTATQNSCWGKIKIEDKYPPQIICQDDTISCWESELFPVPLIDNNPNGLDRCGYPAKTEEISRRWVDYNCQNDTFVGYVIRNVRAIDVWGNYRECTNQRLYIRRDSLNSLVCLDTTYVIECCDDKRAVFGQPDLWEAAWATPDAEGYPHPNVIVQVQYQGNVAKSVSLGLVPPPFFVNGTDTSYITPDSDNHGKCNIVADYKDHIIRTCGYSYKIRREWKILDWCSNTDTICVQWIKVVDTLPPSVPSTLPNITATVGSHDCQAHVELRRPTITECGTKFEKTPAGKENALKQVKAFYQIRYTDPKQHGKEIIISGEVAHGAVKIIYLPAGWYNVQWTFRDDCWNESYRTQRVYVRDITPPTPVCDEHTQITLDPNQCWGRVYAEDLDDGSRDNCCHELHFAVATMDSIEYWRNYWHSVFEGCYNHYEYHDRLAEIDSLIEHWINCFVFNDYVDLYQCGTDSVVMRVYEACGAPLYDPHVFKGTKHQWLCYNLSDDYACWYTWKYDEYAHYGNPRPNLFCDYLNNPVWDVPYRVYRKNSICSDVITEVVNDHGPYRNLVYCSFEDALCDTTAGDRLYNDWLSRVEGPDRQILRAIKDLRYWFPHKYNDCMVEVLKDDKVAPVCIAPADLTVYCDGVPYSGTINIAGVNVPFIAPYLASKNNCGPVITRYPWDGTPHGYYQGPQNTHYGSYSECLDLYRNEYLWVPYYCRLWLMLDTYDQNDNEKPNPESRFGNAAITDNCGTPEVETVIENHLNECGYGYLQKNWIATDVCGNTTECHQKLFVRPRSDFEVIFPEDVKIDCNEGSLEELLDATPEGAGYPEVSDDDCELIGINKEDQIFEVTEEACFKILRTWTIIDWCVYNPDQHHRESDVIVDDRILASEHRPCVYRNLKDDGDGVIYYVQVIKVFDHTPPVITPAEDITVCIENEDCTVPRLTRELGTAEDACTAEENISYRFYTFVNGVKVNGNGNKLNNILPVGHNIVYLIASDNCGNADTAEVNVHIQDCKAPTPYCYHGIATVLMPSTGTITVWAIDLDAGSSDNCSDNEDLTFSFSADPSDGFRTYTCDSIGVVEVEIWVTDEEGNQDFCTTYLSIQDNSGACGTENTVTITGDITTEDNEKVEFVDVRLKNASTQVGAFKTKADGKYAFSSIQTNQSYHVQAERTDDAMNGVSTLDIAFIQKHILGIEKLSSPYKLIAADINRSNSITGVDVVELRKLVLGLYDNMPNNSSWRFVDKSYKFADPEKPWGFPETVQMTNMDKGNHQVNFVAVKVGDVNYNRAAHSLQNLVTRSASTLAFQVEDQVLQAGQEVKVPVYAKDINGVMGYQFTLNLKGMAFSGVTSGTLDVSTDNFGIVNADQGIITTSWNSTKPVNVNANKPLFTLKLRAISNVQLSQAVKVTSQVTHAEAYTQGYEVLDVHLEFVKNNQVVTADQFELFQNTPNPFGDQTTIGFYIPEQGEATIKILDVNGKILKVVQKTFNQGYNELKVNGKELSATGVLYYQLETGAFTTTRKMVFIN